MRADLVLVDLTDALWPEAEELWIEAWAATYSEIDFEARRAFIAGTWTMREAQGVSWRAALNDGAPLGFYCCSTASGYIDQVAVRHSAWGLGVGAALLDDAKARRPEGLSLTVNQDNHRAVRFYEKQGFRRSRADVNGRGQPTWEYAWP